MNKPCRLFHRVFAQPGHLNRGIVELILQRAVEQINARQKEAG